MTLKLNYIFALGNFIQYYYTDLTYIYNFQQHKSGQIKTNEYLKNSPGTFKAFINEFRVARNIEKSKTKDLLEYTTQWIAKTKTIQVDDFADFLKTKGITHNKTMTSLASKILFLNDPWKILPIDNLVKNAVGLKINKYNLYELKFKDFESRNLNEINKSLASVQQHVDIIESNFKGEINNIETIRKNRYLDKILWTIGQKK